MAERCRTAARRAHPERGSATRNHDVQYLLFPDEGHVVNLTTNRISFMRAVERFLARHIGGRDGGDGPTPGAAAGPDTW
jgi:hypothetical protein